MALDAALLDLAAGGGAVLRLYRWDPHCLSFGRHEPAARRYDRAVVESLGIDTVRRPTGGRAVWHAEELTYAVAAPTAAFGDLAAAYRLIHSMLCRAVCSLRVRATLAPAEVVPLSLEAGACFANPVGGEVMTRRGKLVGSAQLRHEGALLQHGSLLLAGDQSLVRTVALGPAAEARSTSLSAELRRPVAFGEVAQAIRLAAESWRGSWHDLRTPSHHLRQLAAQHAPRFQSAEWTWRR